MNYGQTLEYLKQADVDNGVKLRGTDGSFDIDDVTHSKIDSEAPAGFGLFTQAGQPGHPLDAAPLRTVADLLHTFRAIDNNAQNFGEAVTLCTPILRGVPVEQISLEDGVVYFDAATALAVGGTPTDADVAALRAAEPTVVDTLAQAAEPAVDTLAQPCHVSPPAAGILAALIDCMVLRVPQDGSGAMIVDSTDQGRAALGPVDLEHVAELISSKLLVTFQPKTSDAADYYTAR